MLKFFSLRHLCSLLWPTCVTTNARLRCNYWLFCIVQRPHSCRRRFPTSSCTYADTSIGNSWLIWSRSTSSANTRSRSHSRTHSRSHLLIYFLIHILVDFAPCFILPFNPTLIVFQITQLFISSFFGSFFLFFIFFSSPFSFSQQFGLFFNLFPFAL